MTRRSLTESFDIAGEWYLPQEPSRKLAGSIHYEDGKTKLSLNESFQQDHTFQVDNETGYNYPVIHGKSTKAEAITVLNSISVNRNFSNGSAGFHRSEELLSHWLLVGAHVSEETTYPEASFRIPGLQIWLANKIITTGSSTDPQTGKHSVEIKISSQNPETIAIQQIDANVSFSFSSDINRDSLTKAAVEVYAWVSIQPNSPQQLTWFLEQHTKISTFLTLLAGTPMGPDFIELSIDATLHKISLFVGLQKRATCEFKSFHNFFMSRPAMGTELSTAIVHWFEIYPTLHMPSQLALSIFVSQNLWMHVEFLSLMQALEGFHRALFNGKYMKDDDYISVEQKLKDSIPQHINEDLKMSLLSRIHYGNQISLRKRLSDLTKILSDQILYIIFAQEKTTPGIWIDTRNYYTHWDEKLRNNTLDGQAMYDAIIRMRMLLRVLYLDCIQIPQDAILNSLKNASNLSQHITQINTREKTKSSN